LEGQLETQVPAEANWLFLQVRQKSALLVQVAQLEAQAIGNGKNQGVSKFGVHTSAGEAIRAHEGTIWAATRAFSSGQELARNTLGALDIGSVARSWAKNVILAGAASQWAGIADILQRVGDKS
jgi:hypothetical protein